MIDPLLWMPVILQRLQDGFGARLLYLGLQGSYRRGEATESSDIDLVVLLRGKLELDDLDAYRAIVRAMPEGEKACGFFCGAQELLRWPRHELFAFRKDTANYYGNLDDFLPCVTARDAADAALFGAANLTHLLTHSYLYADCDSRLDILKSAYKCAFFIMLVKHYLTSGIYCASKKELLLCLNGIEKEIITAGVDISRWLGSHNEKEAYAMLLNWCKDILLNS